jgi:hypothetical protein
MATWRITGPAAAQRKGPMEHPTSNAGMGKARLHEGLLGPTIGCGLPLLALLLLRPWCEC